MTNYTSALAANHTPPHPISSCLRRLNCYSFSRMVGWCKNMNGIFIKSYKILKFVKTHTHSHKPKIKNYILLRYSICTGRGEGRCKCLLYASLVCMERGSKLHKIRKNVTRQNVIILGSRTSHHK